MNIECINNKSVPVLSDFDSFDAAWQTLIGQCIADLDLVLLSIESIGWTRVCQVLLAQEVLRLDTSLTIGARHQDFSSISASLRDILQKLKRDNVLTWPLLLIRVRMSNSGITQRLGLKIADAHARFDALCVQSLLTGPGLPEETNNGSLFQIVKAPVGEITRERPFSTVADALWRIHVADRTSYSGYCEKSARCATFLRALQRSLSPQIGMVSAFAWSLLQKNNNLQQALLKTDQFQLEGGAIALQAAMQSLISLRVHHNVDYIVVAEKNNQWRVFIDKGKVSQFNAHHLLRKAFSPISKYNNLSYTYVAQPWAELENVSSVSSESVSPRPALPRKTVISCNSSARVQDSKRNTQHNIQPKVSLMINNQLAIQGYCIQLSSREVLAFLNRRQPNSSGALFLISVTSLNEFRVFAQGMMALNLIEKVKVYFYLNFIVSQPSGEIIQILNQIKPYAEIGLFTDQPQGMTELQRWRGPLFTHVMLSGQWLEDIASVELTLRGNCEARIRHLKTQGWALVPFKVGCYKVLACLFRMGVSSMVVTSDFSQELSAMEYY